MESKGECPVASKITPNQCLASITAPSTQPERRQPLDAEFRPLQTCLIAKDFPLDLLLLIFSHYLWDWHDSSSDRSTYFSNRYEPHSPTSTSKLRGSPTRTTFPALILPFKATPALHLSSICALWRFALLSTSLPYSRIALDLQGPSSTHRLFSGPARVRRRANLCQALLARSAPEPLSLNIVADSSGVELWASDARMALARLLKECAKERGRWREVEVSSLADRSLFNLLFWGGDLDEGEWYEKVSQEWAGGVGAPLPPPPRRPLPLREAPCLERLVLRLHRVCSDDEPWVAFTENSSRLGNLQTKRLDLTEGDLSDFICGMPRAYPELESFELVVEGIKETGVDTALMALDAFFQASTPREEKVGEGASVTDPELVDAEAYIRYRLWRETVVANLREKEDRPTQLAHGGDWKQLSVRVQRKKKASGTFVLDSVEGETTPCGVR